MAAHEAGATALVSYRESEVERENGEWGLVIFAECLCVKIVN